MPEHATVVDVSRYFPAPGRRDELLEAMRGIARATAGAEGCFGAQVCESDRDGEALIALSRWESADALERFSSNQAFLAEAERLKDLLARRAEREHFRSL